MLCLTSARQRGRCFACRTVQGSAQLQTCSLNFGGGVRSRVCAWLAYPCSPTCVYIPSPRHQPAIVGSRLYCCAHLFCTTVPILHFCTVQSACGASYAHSALLSYTCNWGKNPSYYHLKRTKVPGCAPVLYHSTHTTFLYCPERLRSLVRAFCTT